MKRLTLIRQMTNDEGTFGTLYGDGFKAVCLELPWRGNKRSLSCAPAGEYTFRWRTDSPKHGACYEEWDDPATPQREDVPNRDNIQIHSANFAGDSEKGWVKQLDGCIALGQAITVFSAKDAGGKKAQHGITASKATMAEFHAWADKELLVVRIIWGPGLDPETEAS